MKGDSSPSRRLGGSILEKWRIWLLVLLTVITIISALFLLSIFEKQRIESRTFERLQQAFNDIPILSEAKLIHQRYYGCTKCRFAGMTALYATELSPEAARTFYLDYLQNSQWDSVGQWEGQVSHGQPEQWCARADWPFADADSREQAITFLANKSELWFTPSEATRRGIINGQTVYIIQIVYTEDKAVRERKCPPNVGGTCERDWWELNKPQSDNTSR